MGHSAHVSRREALRSIVPVTAGTLLVSAVRGERPANGAPGVIRGSIRDEVSGQPVAAKMRVTDLNSGEVFVPPHAIQTMPRRMGSGVKHYFYVKGNFEVAVPAGRYSVEVVRGICHEEVSAGCELGAGMTRVMDLRIPVLRDLHGAGWYSGNTHTHYHLQLEENPDDHLRLVPPAEALDVSVISYLIRNDSPYISNKYPVGRLPEFSRDGTITDMGEEARNNKSFMEAGYGHCLFLNIPRAIEPVSTGLLAKDGRGPDFPTLSMLAEKAHAMGGTSIWCHNGGGMEAPVAVALGHADAYNLGDGIDAEYQRYYRLLNCGFRLPASSGTDWWIYDHNRVFVQVEGSFTYDSWIAGLRAGRTFISNGPLLEFTVNGKSAGATILAGGRLRVKASAVSRIAFERLQIVWNGEVVAEQAAWNQKEAVIEREIAVGRGGWLAARVSGDTRTHVGYRVFAHTSPVYYRLEGTPFRSAEAAGAFIDEIEESARFLKKHYQFASQADQALALGRFEAGKRAYIRLASE